MTPPAPTTPTLSRVAAGRIVRAVVLAECVRLRGTDRPRHPAGNWPDAMAIGDDGLGLDSMEQLGVLGALAETFDLDDTLLERDPPQRVGAWTDWVMRRQAAGDARLTVRTSGSTGTPTACVHAMSDLVAEAQALAGRFAGRRRVVALVPAHHLYGIIWTALLPVMLDCPVVIRTIGAPLGLAAGDLVVAVPDQWQAMLRLVRRFPEDVIGVSSAGPLPDRLGADLRSAGLARLFDIYGSSETGGIALRELPATVYDLLSRWRLLADGAGDWRLGEADGRSHPLPDHIERIGERGLRPVRRRDGAVQVGGHNVWPARIADMLRGLDGVAEAAVRLHANGRLKAFIVPDGDGDPVRLAAAVKRAIMDGLTEPERPKALTFGHALPRNAMGKAEDW